MGQRRRIEKPAQMPDEGKKKLGQHGRGSGKWTSTHPHAHPHERPGTRPGKHPRCKLQCHPKKQKHAGRQERNQHDETQIYDTLQAIIQSGVINCFNLKSSARWAARETAEACRSGSSALPRGAADLQKSSHRLTGDDPQPSGPLRAAAGDAPRTEGSGCDEARTSSVLMRTSAGLPLWKGAPPGNQTRAAQVYQTTL